jgi:hypothetical protein
MWTSIRSRMGSALTVVAVLLTMTLIVAAILFAVQRVFPAQGQRFQSYDLEVTPSAPWHPGQSLSLVWVPSDAGIGPDAPRPTRSRASSRSTVPTPRRPPPKRTTAPKTTARRRPPAPHR